MENHLIESEEATIFSSQPLLHFIESHHRINREPLISEKNCFAELLVDLVQNQF